MDNGRYLSLIRELKHVCLSSLSCRSSSGWSRPTCRSCFQLRTPGTSGSPVYWMTHLRWSVRLSRHSCTFSICSLSSTTRMLALLCLALYSSPAALEVVYTPTARPPASTEAMLEMCHSGEGRPVRNSSHCLLNRIRFSKYCRGGSMITQDPPGPWTTPTWLVS